MIEFSERESRLFALRFARATIHTDFSQWPEMQEQIQRMKLDYLRIKIVNPDADFLNKLSQLSPRVYLTGIVRLYKMRVDQRPGPYFNPEITFQKVLPTDRSLFKEIIKTTYSDYPMGFYRYPELAASFPLPVQLENVSSYFSDYFSGSDAHKEAYIGYIDQEPIACFASDFTDPLVTVSSYAGVREDYRDKGLFRDILRYLTHINFDRGIRKSIGGARLENLPSQLAIEKETAICYGHEWVYMVGFDR